MILSKSEESRSYPIGLIYTTLVLCEVILEG